MPTLQQLVADEVPSTGDVAARGRELEGRVAFVRRGPLEVLARVRDNAEHSVRLRAARDGLIWHCDCEEALRALCPHVAAVAGRLRDA
jgi:uncharacterized Zn finger protein